jgi:hypothetical protein
VFFGTNIICLFSLLLRFLFLKTQNCLQKVILSAACNSHIGDTHQQLLKNKTAEYIIKNLDRFRCYFDQSNINTELFDLDSSSSSSSFIHVIATSALIDRQIFVNVPI